MYLVKVVIILALMVKNFAFEFNGPSLPNLNFIPMWNAPTESCKEKWGVDLDLSDYGIVHNDQQIFHGEFINIFNARLGLWPYYDDNGTALNGGLPQLGDLDGHLQKVASDIQMYIPDTDYHGIFVQLGDLDGHLQKVASDIQMYIPDADYHGIAIIDWENWRPIFDRNWDQLSLYRTLSMNLVRKEHPSWSKQQIETEARKQFETAAMEYMQGTIMTARSIRPKALWGYYGFPRCYNERLASYNCSQEAMEQNDQLSWLFNSSTIIYPSIYLSPNFKYNKTNYAKGNILEAFRMAEIDNENRLPVFPYVRVVYALSELFLNKEDMYATVTQSAELASSGIVIWGSSRDNNKEFCIQLSDYITEFFGPLVQTLYEIAQECGNQYCNGSHGRCRFRLEPVSSYKKHVLLGLKDDWTFLECMCKDGWTGKACEKSTL